MLKACELFIIENPDIKTIEKHFEEYGEKVNDTLELRNVYISYTTGVSRKPIDNPKDREERDWIVKESEKAIAKIKKDVHTRKAVFYNLYKSGLEHNCLNVLHLYVRKKRVYLNVYVRSMNFDTNFGFDTMTFVRVLNKAVAKLKIRKGRVNLHIMSLHKFIINN